MFCSSIRGELLKVLVISCENPFKVTKEEIRKAKISHPDKMKNSYSNFCKIQKAYYHLTVECKKPNTTSTLIRL